MICEGTAVPIRPIRPIRRAPLADTRCSSQMRRGPVKKGAQGQMIEGPPQCSPSSRKAQASSL